MLLVLLVIKNKSFRYSKKADCWHNQWTGKVKHCSLTVAFAWQKLQ